MNISLWILSYSAQMFFLGIDCTGVIELFEF